MIDSIPIQQVSCHILYKKEPVRWVVYVLLGLILFDSNVSLAAFEYEVSGTMSYRFINKNNTNSILLDQEQNFSMSVSDCKWFLKKTPEKFIKRGKPQAMEDYTLASSDTTNFYFLVSFESMMKKRTNAINGASGMIGNGIAPYGKDPTISLLWYAFASGCYFKQVTNEYIPGIIQFRNPGFYSKDFRVKSHWQLISSPPYLPKEIIFTGDYKFLDDNPDPSFPERLSPTNCVYTALEFTNVGELTLPQKGIAEFPTSNSIATTFEFTVSSIVEKSGTDNFTIKIPIMAVISDFRPISQNLPIAVPVGPTKKWPDLNASETAYLKIAQSKKFASLDSDNGTRKSAHILIWLCFIISSGVCLFLAFRWRSNEQTVTN